MAARSAPAATPRAAWRRWSRPSAARRHVKIETESGTARLRPVNGAAASPSIWARRASTGTRFRSPSRSHDTRADRAAGRADRRAGAAFAVGGQCRQSALHLLRRRCRGVRSRPVGPMLEHHPLFPERANISLAQVTAPDRIEAAHLGARRRPDAGLRHGGLRRRGRRRARGATGRKVTVTLPGGDLLIEWREGDEHILMTGPVLAGFRGHSAGLAAHTTRVRMPMHVESRSKSSPSVAGSTPMSSKSCASTPPTPGSRTR